MSAPGDNSKWYPGKYAGLRRSSASSSPIEKGSVSAESKQTDTQISSTHVEHSTNAEGKEKWYPGKMMRRLSAYDITSQDQGKSSRLSEVTTSAAHTTKDTSKMDLVSIGNITVTIEKLKYFSIASCIILMSVDDNVQTPHNIANLSSDCDRDIKCIIPITDISSSLLIQFLDSSTQNSFGRIVIPLDHYLSATKPKNVVVEWRQLYPPYKNNESPDRFRTGYDTIFDHAMSRPKDAIGFAKVSCHIELNRSILDCLTLNRWNPHHETQSIKSTDTTLGELRMKYMRFQRVWICPPILISFLNIPNVFVLIATLFFLTMSAAQFTWPFLLLATVYYNGQLYSADRSFSHFIQWNNAVTETRVANGKSEAKSVEKTLDPNIIQLTDELDHRLDGISLILEKWTNLWSYADHKVSYIAYSYAFTLAAMISLLLMILKAKIVFLIILSFILLAYATRDKLREIVESAEKSDAAISNGALGLKLVKFNRSLKNFWSRVPDELELFHRYVSQKSIIKEGGAEMLDAALTKKN